MTVYFVEVWDQFGELEFRRAFTSPEKRLAALAKWCRKRDEDSPSVWADIEFVKAYFHPDTGEKYELYTLEIE